MKSLSRIHSPALALLCGVAIAGGLAAPRARADEWNKKTTLTVNEPVQVKDTVLDPGTYVFKLLDSNSDRHIVQIYNSDQTHLINTVMAVPDYRLRPTGNSHFLFWETPPGNVKALRAWFYPGDNFGQEFPYPAHPATLQAEATAPSPAPAVTNNQPAPATAPETAEAAAQPAPQQTAPAQEQPEIAQNNGPAETAPAQEQPEIAQNNTPPPAPAAQQQPAQQPKQLPQTASDYPLIGLAGLSLLGIAGLLRLKRLA